ncbi:unnamed protein product [Orchesella dallaii]|uniref:Rab9 effector protein with kelch motifs n=1 Tax=Orchesella dallaii TaxID=48710 RepID=A0ABP1R0G8_9HEXA
MTEGKGESASDIFLISKLSDIEQPFKWHSLKIPGLEKIEPRVGHAIVSLKNGELLMIGGGNHNGPLQEMYAINLQPSITNVEESEERVKEHPAKTDFPARYEFSCAKDSSNNVWIFGGADVKSTMNEVFMINSENIVEVVPHEEECEAQVARPSSRTQGNNSALVDWKGKQYMAVFAGGLKGEQAVEDRNLYLFDINEYVWEVVKVNTEEKVIASFPFACQPPAVQGQVMTAIGSKILVHGGINGLSLYGGMHWIDLEKVNEDLTRNWIDLEVEMLNQTKPAPRAAHGIAKASDVNKGSSVVYIFGGLGEKGALNDLWSFNIESKTWTQILPKDGEDEDCKQMVKPEPRLDFAMCCVGLQDEDSDQLTLFLIIHGGMNPQGEIFKDMWVMKIGAVA